jgi:hypothetical protein
MTGVAQVESTVNNTVAQGTLSLRAECTAPEEQYCIPFRKFNGPVYAICPTIGGVYVTGRFTTYDSLSAPGICRVKWDGSLDTTFNPGTGFSIAEPYYAPTQLQAARNGGVFVGLSWVYLQERGFHTTTNNYANLRFNGVTYAPVIKLTSAGAYDATFDTTHIAIATINPYFLAFHMAETVNHYFFMYQKEHSGTFQPEATPTGSAGYVTIERRNAAGALQFGVVNWGADDWDLSHFTYDPEMQRVNWVSYDFISTAFIRKYTTHNGNYTSINTTHPLTTPTAELIQLDTNFDIVDSFTYTSQFGGVYGMDFNPTRLCFGSLKGSFYIGGVLNKDNTQEWTMHGGGKYNHRGCYNIQTRQSAGSQELWDISNPLSANINDQGFDTLDATGYYEPSNRTVPLFALKEWNRSQTILGPEDGVGNTPGLGVYITGRFTRFKDVTIFPKPYMLAKISAQGNLRGNFHKRVFGAEPYVDAGKGDCASAVFCAHLSPDQKILYVGGRFKELDGDTAYFGAVSLDAITGEICT